jgi:hypothetical protein
MNLPFLIASEAKPTAAIELDCFVAALLAMTGRKVHLVFHVSTSDSSLCSERQSCPAVSPVNFRCCHGEIRQTGCADRGHEHIDERCPAPPPHRFRLLLLTERP